MEAVLFTDVRFYSCIHVLLFFQMDKQMDQSASPVEEEEEEIKKEGRETGKAVYNRSGSVPVFGTEEV